MDKAEVIQKAWSIMAERGLAKHVRVDDQGRVCAYGALFAVTIIHDACVAANLMGKVAEELFPERAATRDRLGQTVPLVCVNNHPNTTLEDMMTVFEKSYIKALEMVD